MLDMPDHLNMFHRRETLPSLKSTRLLNHTHVLMCMLYSVLLSNINYVSHSSERLAHRDELLFTSHFNYIQNSPYENQMQLNSAGVNWHISILQQVCLNFLDAQYSHKMTDVKAALLLSVTVSKCSHCQ